jgi:hypothetical protein
VQPVIKFDKQYDVERMARDLEVALRWGALHMNRGDYHDGGWRAVPLHGVEGRTDAQALRWAGWSARYDKTPILLECPYFEEIVDEFQCPKERVRLLRLEPGKNINTHTDLGDGWAMGKVRLHIPIITHDEVYFYVDEQRVIMRPGELWYCDFTHPHRVHNRSNVARVHLVLDVRVNDWLRSFFPPEPVTDKLRNAAQRARYFGNYYARQAAAHPALAPVKQQIKRVLDQVKSGRAAAP